MRKPDIHNEAELMEGFRLGLEKSFSLVFHQLYPALCFYALKITNDQAAAEDIAEESFIKIWERREMFYKFAVLKSYLYTTVKNASLNWLTVENRRRASEQNLTVAPVQPEKLALESMIQAEVLRELYTAIDNLPPQCRKIFTMMYVDGKTTRQISEELKLSIDNVKNQKARGLWLLRKKMPTLSFILLMINIF